MGGSWICLGGVRKENVQFTNNSRSRPELYLYVGGKD